MDKTKYVWQEFSIEIHYLWKEGLHKEKYDCYYVWSICL